ncbi:MAG: acyltransferase family protein [Chromatocurvus sp.]
MRRALIRHVREVFVPPPGRAAAIDGLRALAILMVVAFHCVFLAYYVLDGNEAVRRYIEATPAWLVWVWNGDKGVDLFFVLSGFLISRALLREIDAHQRINYRRFMANRLLRIVPLYVAVLALGAAVGMPNSEYFWANLLFVNNWLEVERMFIPWSWSVTIEMQFYLLAPLLVWAIHHRGQGAPAWLLVLILAGMVGRAMVFMIHPEYASATLHDSLTGNRALGVEVWDALYVNLYTRAGPLLLGMAAAWVVERHAGSIRAFYARRPGVFNAAVVAALALSTLMLSSALTLTSGESLGSGRVLIALQWIVGRDVFALGIAVILVAAFLGLGVGRWLDWFLSARIWFPIAQVSYSIYFLHIFFVGAAYHLLYGGERTAALGLGELGFVFVFTLLGSFAAAVVTFALIERPFLHLKRKGAAAVPRAVVQTEAA